MNTLPQFRAIVNKGETIIYDVDVAVPPWETFPLANTIVWHMQAKTHRTDNTAVLDFFSNNNQILVINTFPQAYTCTLRVVANTDLTNTALGVYSSDVKMIHGSNSTYVASGYVEIKQGITQ